MIFMTGKKRKKKAEATKQFLNALDRCPETEWKKNARSREVLLGQTKNAMLNSARTLD
jgi:hypothetical protein